MTWARRKAGAAPVQRLAGRPPGDPLSTGKSLQMNHLSDCTDGSCGHGNRPAGNRWGTEPIETGIKSIVMIDFMFRIETYPVLLCEP